MDLDNFNPFEENNDPLWDDPREKTGIDFKSALNEDQYAAVTAPDGPALVLAGAGSGKTRTLTYRVAYLLEKGVPPHQILLLTFTNKAAREMLERVEDLTGVPRGRFWGGTFHSIGQRVLRMYGEPLKLQKNFTILDQSDSEALMASVVKSVDPSFLTNKDNPKPKMIAGLVSYARNTDKTLDQVLSTRYTVELNIGDKIMKFAEVYEKEKRSQQVVDYDDLLEMWLELMEKDESTALYLQERFKYVLVDEYQDTNIIQSKIVDKIASRHQLMAVGDDAQCIYTWRGANYENVTTFSDRHPGTTIYKIEINYRSSPEILNFANRILDDHVSSNPFDKELRPFKSSTQKPYFVTAMDTQHQAQFVMARLRDLMREGYTLSDVIILYRAHYQAMDMQMELGRNGVPFQITSGMRFFEQAHIKDLTAQLRFASNPDDQISFQRFTGLLPRIGVKTAERIYRDALRLANKEGIHIIQALSDKRIQKKVPEYARVEWPSLTKTLQDVRKGVTENLPPQEIVSAAVDGWYGDYIRTVYENWESRMDDLNSVIGFAERFADIGELLAQLVLLNSETSDKGVDLADDKLKLSTIHQAKGLEFPIVFILGMADGFFPLKRAMDNGDTDEERRLFYVAVTRAMEQLYMVYPTMSIQGNYVKRMPPSQFVGAIPTEYYQSGRLPKR